MNKNTRLQQASLKTLNKNEEKSTPDLSRNQTPLYIQTRKEINLVYALPSFVLYSALCIVLGFWLKGKNTPIQSLDISGIRDLQREVSDLKMMIGSGQDNQEIILAQWKHHRELINKNLKDILQEKLNELSHLKENPKESPSKLQEDFQNLKEIKLEEWSHVLPKAMPFNQENNALLKEVHYQQYSDFEKKINENKRKLAKSLNFENPKDKQLYQAFLKKAEIDLYRLKQDQWRIQREFKEKQILSSN